MRPTRSIVRLSLALALLLGGLPAPSTMVAPAAHAAAPSGGARKPRPKKPDGRPAAQPGRTQVGKASYYARRFHGRRTASGERYDERAMTCAHPTLPFGARVRIEHLGNGRSVVLRVNDRGPFARRRIVDVSRAAAQALGMIEAGEARVALTVISR